MKTTITKCDRCDKECGELALHLSYREMIPYCDKTELIEKDFCSNKCFETALFGNAQLRGANFALNELYYNIPKKCKRSTRKYIESLIAKTRTVSINTFK